MTSTAKLRLPLQTGAQTIFGTALASAFVAVAGPLLVVGIFGDVLWLALIGVMFVLLALTFLSRSWNARPSDIELDPEGLVVLGGPNGGAHVAWKKVRCCEIRYTREDACTLVLVLVRREIVLGHTMDDDEEDSLTAVHATIEALREPKPQPAREPPTESRLLACTACGALASPSDAPSVACPSCTAVIEMPEAIREKVAASVLLSKSRRAVEHYASRFLGATQLSRARWAMAPTFLAVAAWLAACGFGISWYLRGASSAWGILFLDVALGLLAPGMTSLFAGALVDRQAAPVLAFRLGAEPPAKPGAPHGCRCCGGPLPEPKDGVVSRCVFCNADNVLGVSLGREAAREAEQAGLLEATVSRTRTARRRWQRVGLGIGIACVAGSTLAALHVPSTAPVRTEAGARDLRRITWNPFDDARSPRPSRDGSKIMYAIQEHVGKNPGLVDGVVSSSGGKGTTWPVNDATRALFPDTSEEPREVAVPSSGGCTTEQGSASPDGRRIAYVADCDGHKRLHVMTVATGASRTLTSGAAAVQHPRWSREWIYFDAGGSVFRLRPE